MTININGPEPVASEIAHDIVSYLFHEDISASFQIATTEATLWYEGHHIREDSPIHYIRINTEGNFRMGISVKIEGPPHTGKTRLARHIAKSLLTYCADDAVSYSDDDHHEIIAWTDAAKRQHRDMHYITVTTLKKAGS